MIYTTSSESRTGSRVNTALVRISTVVAVALAGLGLAQAENAANRFKLYDGTQNADASRIAALGTNQSGKFMVVMSEMSIADARAMSPTHSSSDEQNQSIASRVRSQQDAVQPLIEAHGGHVIERFHGALNGMKVQLDSANIAAVAALAGVVQVLPVGRYLPDNSSSVPYIGAPAVWQGNPKLRGEGVKVAIIDTGIDYTHANFGGPGTPAAFVSAKARSTGTADRRLFGPGAPKVKGGIDLVGDDYNGSNSPVPDSNPLDCAGHGSHVAGTVAGFGVDSNGASYTGPYNEAAYKPGAFRVGPGVAPKADLYAVRVFGCSGSTDMVVEAVDWAVHNHMDVINLSLGSSYGYRDSADALALANAVKAGIVVVASAGNAGPQPYLAGSPSTGDGVISVAAIDGKPSYPGASITIAGGVTLQAQNSNDAVMATAVMAVVVLRNPDGSVSLGCNESEYAGTAGKLVVALRGVCNRVDRAIFGQSAGAAAVALINNAAGFPSFEGPIQGVSIPFLGIRGTGTDAVTLTGASNVILASAAAIPNAALGTTAYFSSGGPRMGDSTLKPSVSAPGVNTLSTLVGSGTEPIMYSGTSMAAPHITGVAALVHQARPQWSVGAISKAVVQTANAQLIPHYAARLNGAGLVQTLAAASTESVVTVLEDPTATAISFGFAEFSKDFKATRHLQISNKASRSVTFQLSANATGGDPHQLGLSKSSITIGAGQAASIEVTLTVPSASAGDSSTFNDVAGLVKLKPATVNDNHGVALSLPYYLVERARSELSVAVDQNPGVNSLSSVARVRNVTAGGKSGSADFYVLGLRGSRQGAAPYDLRAVGVQSFPADNMLVFAANTFDRFNTAAAGEVDILINPHGDGTGDYMVFAMDHGWLTGNPADGISVVAVYNFATGKTRLRFYTDAPTDGSTMLLPILLTDIGLSPANPRFEYQAFSYNNLNGGSNGMPGSASFNAFTPAVSNGDYVNVAPGLTASVTVTVNPAEWAHTPSMGVMVVEKENASGASQAALLRAPAP
jgi:subtilisin family serine protease